MMTHLMTLTEVDDTDKNMVQDDDELDDSNRNIVQDDDFNGTYPR